jgi:hypothetical protein
MTVAKATASWTCSVCSDEYHAKSPRFYCSRCDFICCSDCLTGHTGDFRQELALRSTPDGPIYCKQQSADPGFGLLCDHDGEKPEIEDKPHWSCCGALDREAASCATFLKQEARGMAQVEFSISLVEDLVDPHQVKILAFEDDDQDDQDDQDDEDPEPKQASEWTRLAKKLCRLASVSLPTGSNQADIDAIKAKLIPLIYDVKTFWSAFAQVVAMLKTADVVRNSAKVDNLLAHLTN